MRHDINYDPDYTEFDFPNELSELEEEKERELMFIEALDFEEQQRYFASLEPTSSIRSTLLAA